MRPVPPTLMFTDWCSQGVQSFTSERGSGADWSSPRELDRLRRAPHRGRLALTLPSVPGCGLRPPNTYACLVLLHLLLVPYKTRAESFHPRKHGLRGGMSNAGGSGGVWDCYPSMDLKIHEDIQGNVFVKAGLTRPTHGYPGVWLGDGFPAKGVACAATVPPRRVRTEESLENPPDDRRRSPAMVSA